MELCILKKPKKYTMEQWLDILSEVMGKTYCLLGKGVKIVKAALYEVTTDKEYVSYRAFESELVKPQKENETDEMYENRLKVANRVCQLYLKDCKWTDKYDIADAKGLESLSTKILRAALEESGDDKFSRLVLNIWTKINLPEKYAY